MPLIANWEREKLLKPSEAAALLHRSPSVIYAYFGRGVRAPDGAFVRLESVNLGGRVYTSREAVQRWIERISAPLDKPTPPSEREMIKEDKRARKSIARILERP